MKVFISHQKADSDLSAQIAQHLKIKHSINSYLDVIDPSLRDGPEIADHVRKNLGECSQLLAVVSEATAKSWWVPWEIGIATEKDFPLATYSTIGILLPEYLQKWPYLENMSDLDKYAHRVKLMTKSSFESANYDLQSRSTSSSSTRDFYRKLRADLGQ